MISILVRTRCFDYRFIFRSRLIVALHIRAYLTKCFDKWFIFRNFWFLFTCSDFESCLYAKCLIICVSHRKSDQKLFCWRRFLYNFIRFTVFSYWFQDAFHIEMFDQKLSRTNDVFFYKTWWHVKQLHVKFSISFCCQCECDISKVINFCFTWIAHEICDNRLIKHLYLKVVFNVHFTLDSWICFCCNHFSIRLKNSRIINIIILYLSTITFDAQSRKKIIRKIVFFIIVDDIYYIMFLNMFRTVIASINWKTVALFNIRIFHSSMITIDASRISKKTKFFIEL